MEQKQAPVAPQVTGLQRFNNYIANPNTQNYLQSLLKDKVSSFVSNLTAIVAQDDKLQACTPATLMYAAVKATGMGLPIDNSLGHVYVIPFNNSKKGITEAQLQIGYKGFKQLALRSGEFLRMHETDIRSGELLFNNFLTGEISFKFEQDPKVRKQLAIIGYVSYFKLRNGFESTLFMTVEDLEEHAMRYSQSYRSTNKWVHDTSKWMTDKAAMSMKGLSLDTIIPTPDGYTTMGEIKVGDELFNALGEVTTVIAKSEVKNLPCYEIEFQNGQTFIADCEHRWFAKGASIKRNEWDILTTEEIYIAKKLGFPVVIPQSPSVEFESKELLIPPYILGYWLGNGNSYSASLSCCEDDADELISYIEGYSVSKSKDPRNNTCTLHVSSLSDNKKDGSLVSKLRELNLLKNKHIPNIYKRSSREQREELIRGLCDSDGCIDNTRGRVKYCSVKEELAYGAYEILCSLGERCTIRSGISKGFGRDTLFYEVEWKPKTFNPVKLKRKAERYKEPILSSIGTSIKAVRKIESVPTQCIAVESGDATDEVDFRKSFLIGEGFYPTHNTVCKLNLSRNAPLSIELRDAILSDQAIFREPDKPSYDDNPDEPLLDPEKAQQVMDKFKEYKTEEDAKIISEEKL